MTRITRFKGELPKVNAKNLPPGFACEARDVKLWHDDLRPFLKPKLVCELSEKFCKVERHPTDCCWVGSCHPCACILPLASDCQPTIISQPDDVPRVVRNTTTTGCECKDTAGCTLGLPVPVGKLTAGDPRDCTEHGTMRRYLVTYLRHDCDMESAPGAASDPIMVESCNRSVTVGNIPVPPPDACVDSVLVYRLESVWDVEKQFKQAEGGDLIHSGYYDTATESNWFLAAVLPAGVTTFTDTVDGDKLGQTLMTWGFFPPETGLCVQGILDTGQLVGFKDNILWLSEKNAGHAWPLKNRLALDHKIKRIFIHGPVIWVLTDGAPYTVSLKGECHDIDCLTVVKARRSLPVCNPDSVVHYDGFVYYASKLGLVRLASSGDMIMQAEWLFAPDDWEGLDPATMTGVIYNGQYFFTSSCASGYFDINGNESSVGLVRLTYRPQQWIVDSNEDLYMLHDGNVYQWDAEAEYMPYLWRSGQIIDDSMSRVTALQIEHDGVCAPGTAIGHDTMVRFCRDGRTVFHERVPDAVPRRFRDGRAMYYQTTIRGTSTVRGLHYGPNTRYLNRGPHANQS